MRITGRVVSGLGEGRRYMKKYKKNLEKALGMKFYSGTLNIRVKKQHVFRKAITIEPPSEGLFTVRCVKARINRKTRGAIVLPVKTRHKKNIIEIIAPVNLRKALKLKDGDILEAETNPFLFEKEMSLYAPKKRRKI